MLEAYENRLPGEKLSLLVSLPFISVHVGALFALTISPSPFALFMVFLMYFIRMFGITAGFHRFFSHKTFKTSRAFQFILAYLATSSAQMGPIWWASHHRHHHKYTDEIKPKHQKKIDMQTEIFKGEVSVPIKPFPENSSKKTFLPSGLNFTSAG